MIFYMEINLIPLNETFAAKALALAASFVEAAHVAHDLGLNTEAFRLLDRADGLADLAHTLTTEGTA